MPACSKCKPIITGEGSTNMERSLTMVRQNTGGGKKTLPRLLESSWRISRAAPPMKPFLYRRMERVT